jgi:hypothetical protein
MIRKIIKYFTVLLICLVFSCKEENKEIKAIINPIIKKTKSGLENDGKTNIIVKNTIEKAVEKKKGLRKRVRNHIVENTPTISTMVDDEKIEEFEDFNILATFKSYDQLRVDSTLELQVKNIDSTKYGFDLGMYIPPFYIIDNDIKKYIYAISSKYTLLYFSDTTAFAYKEPLIDSLINLWFLDTLYRKALYTQHISLATANDHMFSNDSIPGRSISNFKENYNNGGFDLKKLFNLSTYPTFFLLDSAKKIVSINPSIESIKNIIK